MLAALVELAALVVVAVAIAALARGRHPEGPPSPEPEHSRAWFEALVDNSSDLICLLDAEGAITWVSGAAARILGHDPRDWLGRSFIGLVHPEDQERVRHAFDDALPTVGPLPPIELRVVHANGTWRHFETFSTNLLSDPAVQAVVTNSRDVTDRVEAVAEVEHRALHDPLTGLANRTLLVDRLEQAVQRAQRSGQTLSVLYLDLDRFKTVNDHFGHSGGDRLLVVVSQRLAGAVRPGDTVARIGGDEFIVVTDGADVDDAIGIAERIRTAVAEPVLLPGGETVVTSVSIGIAMGSGPSSVDGLLRDADLALYRAKDNGRDRYEVFEPGSR